MEIVVKGLPSGRTWNYQRIAEHIKQDVLRLLQKNRDTVEEIVTRQKGQSPSERGGDTKVCKTWKEGVAKVQDADVASEKSNSERTWMESENIQHEQLSDLL